MDGTRERRNRRPGVAVATPRGWYQFSAGKTEITTEYYWPLWLLNQIFLESSNTVVDTQTASGDDDDDGAADDAMKRKRRRERQPDDADDDDAGARRRWEARRRSDRLSRLCRGRRASGDVAMREENRRRCQRMAPKPRARRKEEERLSTWRRKRTRIGGGWNALM